MFSLSSVLKICFIPLLTNNFYNILRLHVIVESFKETYSMLYGK